jgi:nucleoside-diphosphate-sugar epimerase
MIDPSFIGSFTGIPDQLYGWAKLTGENLAHRARQEGLNVTVIRPFSGYGPDQDVSYPFSAFIARAKAREDPFTVWGSGQQVRDFIHVSDIVSATLHMAENGIDGPLNLGTGRAVSILQLARMVCQAAGYSPEIRTLGDKPSGVAYRVADVTELHKVYTPEISLEQGILEALR